LKGLYVGIKTQGTTSQLRADTLRAMVPSCDWTQIDTDLIFTAYPRWARSLWFRLRTGPAVWALNKYVINQLGADRYDVAWIDKGVCLWPSTLRVIRDRTSKLIYYTPDTSFLANRSRHFFASAALYDLIVTTKSQELAEFERRVGANRVSLVTQSFDSRLHFPRCPFQEKRHEAVLIGLCEPDREKCVEELFSHGISVRVGGRGWEYFLCKHARNPLLVFEGAGVFGNRYAEALSYASVGLGLLTKRFPELHTTRTFEIPACGTALVTEPTAEINAIFTTHEAIYFDGAKDLGRRVADLMYDRQRLAEISLAGQRRVNTGDFSNKRVLRKILQRINVPCLTEV
jgi:spore maturation protein CgeB